MTSAQLLQWRQRHGLTQKKAAHAFGVASNTVARWERGKLAIPHWVPLLAENAAYTSRIGIEAADVPRSAKPPSERSHRAAKRRLIAGLSLIKGASRGLSELSIPAVHAALTADERRTWSDISRESSRLLWELAERLIRYTDRIR